MARADDLLDPRVQVVVVPPSDPAAAGHAELQGVGSGEDTTEMPELARRAWLTQDEPIRGAELETLGLTIATGHPELSLVNVPTAFIENGVRLLKELGTYVLAGGSLNDGDFLQMRHDLPHLVGAMSSRNDDGQEIIRIVLLA
ncbi:MAG: hypothetical protein AB7V42_04135 [Thermoleophilia bacterium]